MAVVYKEVAKVDGMPVMQLISMSPTGQPSAAGAPSDGSAPPPQQQQQQQAPPPSAGGVLGGALGGKLGGLGGFGRKKPPADKPAADQPANPPAGGGQPSGAPGALIEMTTEMSKFSANDADPSLFEIPAGFKKVDSDLKKMK